MSATLAALPPPSTTLMLLEGRAMPEFGAFWLLRPWLSVTPRGDGHPVLVLPGLLADDSSTRPLAQLPQFTRLPRARLEAGPQLRPARQPRARHAGPHRRTVRALRSTQDQPRRLEPGRPLCTPPRQARARHGAQHDQPGRPLRRPAPIDPPQTPP